MTEGKAEIADRIERRREQILTDKELAEIVFDPIRQCRVVRADLPKLNRHERRKMEAGK